MKELHYQLCYLAYSRLLWLYRFLGKKVTIIAASVSLDGTEKFRSLFEVYRPQNTTV